MPLCSQRTLPFADKQNTALLASTFHPFLHPCPLPCDLAVYPTKGTENVSLPFNFWNGPHNLPLSTEWGRSNRILVPSLGLKRPLKSILALLYFRSLTLSYTMGTCPARPPVQGQSGTCLAEPQNDQQPCGSMTLEILCKYTWQTLWSTDSEFLNED